MSIDIYLTLIAFTVSCASGFVMIPIVLDFCKRKGLYDLPNLRKVHKTKTPRLGGVVFFPCVFIACALVYCISQTNNQSAVSLSPWTIYFLIGSVLIYTTGLIDDIIGLSASVKLAIQIIAASALPLSFLYVNNLHGFFGVYDIPFYVGAPLTVLFVGFISNAINLIDGIDGLSSSLSIISLLGFLYYYMEWGLIPYVIIIAAIIGVLVAFLFFNLFGSVEKNRKIFMGDTGSLTLGFLLAFLSLKLSMINESLRPFPGNGLFISYTLLLVPVFDAVRVALVRIVNHHSPITPDKNHIHHKLLRAGCSQHQGLVAIIGLAVFYIAVNWALSGHVTMTIIVIIDILLYVFFHQIVNIFIKKQHQAVTIF